MVIFIVEMARTYPIISIDNAKAIYPKRSRFESE
jgi:hypothetical protein